MATVEPQVSFLPGPDGFADRVRVCRLLMGMSSQSDLAKASNVSKQVISNFENGATKTPMIGTLSDVSRALECNAEWLWRGDGDAPLYLDPRPYASAFIAGHSLGRLGVLHASIEWPTGHDLHGRWFHVGLEKGQRAKRNELSSPTDGAL